MKSRERTGVYCIPLQIDHATRKTKVGVVKYKDGYGFLGGGVEGGETLEEALRRELQEELGEHPLIVEEGYIITPPYVFLMPKGKRSGQDAHVEKHYFFLAAYDIVSR